MLDQLLALNEVSLNISTSANGQKNIVVISNGNSPLTLTGKVEDSKLMESDILKYTQALASVQTSSNLEDAISKALTKATPDKGKAQPKAKKTDGSAETVETATSAKTDAAEEQTSFDEASDIDSLFDELGL